MDGNIKKRWRKTIIVGLLVGELNCVLGETEIVVSVT